MNRTSASSTSSRVVPTKGAFFPLRISPEGQRKEVKGREEPLWVPAAPVAASEGQAGLESNNGARCSPPSYEGDEEVASHCSDSRPNAANTARADATGDRAENSRPGSQADLEVPSPAEGSSPPVQLASLTALGPLHVACPARTTPSATTPSSTPLVGTSCLHAEIPKYSGYADTKSIAEFLDEFREEQAVSEMSEFELLPRVLPIALTGNVATWHRRQPPFSALQHFSEHFKTEPLPPDNGARMLDELMARTQNRDESLVEFVRALQTDKSLNELAQAAHQIQADILAELKYRPPPPPEACLEPSCAWTGTTRTIPRALEPYTHAVGDGAHVRERDRQYQAPSRERYPSETPAPLRCFRCGSLGQVRRECTRRASNDNSGNEPRLKPPVMSPMLQHLVWRQLERPMMLPLTDYAATLLEAIAEMPQVPAWRPPEGPMILPLTNYAVALSEAPSDMPPVVPASVLSSKPPTRQFLMASWSPSRRLRGTDVTATAARSRCQRRGRPSSTHMP
ncbi:hypothetical protein HPB47_008360 [Ixodes persulcatus]|uniref:Uncharacterized protein n=1 Tax=Ixodes persulcatus TaxID=34615 RepID=A0AC60P511_IXOPE|nr:hypothetical protein HPB47_008360 [Ixodes persulcatus]